MDDNKKEITVVEVFKKLEEVEKQNKEILEKLENMQESNAFFTKVAVRKWGNSQGIRLSKEIISRMGLKENDEIEINVDNGRMVIEKAKPEYQNLQDRLEAFYGKAIDEIYVENTKDVLELLKMLENI